MCAPSSRELFDRDSQGSVFYQYEDSLAERSKAPDSSSGGEIRVGSNPTVVSLLLESAAADEQPFAKPPRPASNRQSLD